MQTVISHPAEDIQTEFLTHLPVVKQVIRAVCRRQGLSPAEEAEFAGSVFLKLIDNDYAVFRRFRGQSELRAFLYAVVYHHLLDQRNSEWGKWRPSARARQLGSAAVFLEKLVARDGVGLQEAVGMVVNHPRWQLSSRDVVTLHAELEPRARRARPVEAAEAHEVSIPDTPETELQLRDLRQNAHRARTALVAAFECLDTEDRRLLRMRFQDGLSVIAIAEATGVDAKALYRRFDRLLERLRGELEKRDLTSSIVRVLVGHAGVEFGSSLPRSGTPAG